MFKIHLLKTKVELENPNMAADYGEVHGKGSWQLFPEGLEENASKGQR